MNIIYKNTYFGSFNLPYYEDHAKILGTSWIKTKLREKLFNPRIIILKHFENGIKTLDQFVELMQYNGYQRKQLDFLDDPSFNNPSVGLSSRGDLEKNLV